MDTGEFFAALKLPATAGMDDIERRFLEVVRERIQAVAESYDENAVAAEERWLREFHNLFFQKSLQSAAKLAQEKKEKDHPDAVKLRAGARGAVESLQKNIVEFSLCYMHINRFVTLLRDQIKKEEIRVGMSVPKNVKWTADAGVIITRHKKRKQQLLADNKRLGEARATMEAIERDLISLRGAAAALFGRDKAEPLMRKVVGALRIADFRRSRKVLKEIADMKKKFGLDPKALAEAQKKFEETGAGLIETVSANAKALMGPDEKLFLRPIEVDVAWNSQVHELRKIKSFLAKYHLPYMQYKVDTLHHLKDKLLVVGSIESLLILYKRLIMGIAGPLTAVRDVRLYENEVLDRVSWLLDGQFQEVPKILDRARETVEEFRQGRKDFEDMEQLQVEEIAVDQDQAAAGG